MRWRVPDEGLVAWLISFRIASVAASTSSSSGMSDKMILIPHINEINEFEWLEEEERGFFLFFFAWTLK